MLKAVQLPAGVTDLTTSLANVDGDTLAISGVIATVNICHDDTKIGVGMSGIVYGLNTVTFLIGYKVGIFLYAFSLLLIC